MRIKVAGKNPLVSIITVVRNGGKTLESAINSVLDIDSDDFEYIIIDGSSTDDTLEIIKKYENRITYWVSEPDKGVYDAMNKGIMAASGKYLYFLGADDCLVGLPTSFDGDIVCGNVDYGYGYFKHGNPGEVLKKIKYRNSIHPQGTFYKNYGLLYNGEYPLCADYLFNIEYIKRGRLVTVNQVVAKFSPYGLSSGWKAKWEIIKIAYDQFGLISGVKSFSYHALSLIINSIKLRLTRGGGNVD